jgi:hypothetical protein
MSKNPAPSKAARELKRLREVAGITIPQAADATGYKGRMSSYQHWEDRTKKDILPLDVIRGLAMLYEQKGFDSGPLWPLAGLTSSEAASSGLIHKKTGLTHSNIKNSDTSIGHDYQAKIEEGDMIRAKAINIFDSLNADRQLHVFELLIRELAKQEAEGEAAAARPPQQRA